MRGNKVTEGWPPIDRHPSENGQELTGLAEGTYPYRYKTDGWRVRSGWPRMHGRFPLRFHAADRRPVQGSGGRTALKIETDWPIGRKKKRRGWKIGRSVRKRQCSKVYAPV